ncbi:MAG: glycerophosphodiester phosphodiesterase family protein, partial [[Clostridium] nexile]
MTKIFAHRGASGYAPENTLEAFALAMDIGADGIELDVQMTKDGEVVVIHDETINRVSDGKGRVKDYTLVQLREFSFDNHMEGYGHVSIPTLKEVLELVRPSKMDVNIELKTGIYWYPTLEEKVMEIVKNCGMEERVIYSSFNHYSVQKVRELDSKAETAYLYSDVILDVEN